MEIKGMAHCFFEQSGKFKNEFIKLGIPAADYDIQNNFGETDHVIDLFAEIENAYGGGISIFDKITKDDLIMAFFPCIYFESVQQMYYSLDTLNNRHKPITERIIDAIERIDKRTYFHLILYKMVFICYKKNLRMVIENPAGPNGFITTGQNFIAPTFIDKNRLLRGDYFKKPTAYWFINCEMTHGMTIKKDKKQRIVNRAKPAKEAGLCSEERSMLSPDYARNFICDFILGKEQIGTQLTMFE